MADYFNEREEKLTTGHRSDAADAPAAEGLDGVLVAEVAIPPSESGLDASLREPEDCKEAKASEAGPNGQDGEEKILLVGACKQRPLMEAVKLVEYRENVDSRDDEGNTALMLAVRDNKELLARAQLSRCVDVWLRNGEGETAADIAARHGREALMDLLADERLGLGRWSIWRTTFHYTRGCVKNHLDRYGADVDERWGGMTVLQYALGRKNIPFSVELIGAGARLDAGVRGVDSPLDLIIRLGVESYEREMADALPASARTEIGAYARLHGDIAFPPSDFMPIGEMASEMAGGRDSDSDDRTGLGARSFGDATAALSAASWMPDPIPIVTHPKAI